MSSRSSDAACDHNWRSSFDVKTCGRCGAIEVNDLPEWVSVQRGLWRSLWLVLRGERVREWELWPRAEADEALTLEDA